MKEKIKLNFSDFYSETCSELMFFKQILESKFQLIHSAKPDFIIYSTFGNDYLNFDCTKIFYTGENIRPNFNLCDYALGFDLLTFEDRYYRLPFYRHWPLFRLADKIKHIRLKELEGKKFCNFIYSNGSGSVERTVFFDILSTYKRVDSGGRLKNNLGYLVEDKLKFMQAYKFSIAFENVSSNGYTTEKILDAKVAGTIPIYWGNKKIDLDFNTKSFINCHDYETFEEVVNLIKYLDNNDEAYIKMANEPLFISNKIPENLSEEKIAAFFFDIIKQGPRLSKRRCNLLHEKSVENELKIFMEIKNNPFAYLKYNLKKLSKKIKYKVERENYNNPKRMHF
jgi:hypothetical protein